MRVAPCVLTVLAARPCCAAPHRNTRCRPKLGTRAGVAVGVLYDTDRGKLIKKLAKLEGEKKINNAAQKQLDTWVALAKKKPAK